MVGFARRSFWRMGSGSGGREPMHFSRGPTAPLPLSVRRRRQDGRRDACASLGDHQRWQRPAASGKVGAGVAAEHNGPPPLGRAGAACADSAA